MNAATTPARRRPGPLPAGADARELLLDAAERLFALHGVDAVSLRSISAAAGLTSAVLHYHFGSRDELLRAVLQRRRTSLEGAPLLEKLEARESIDVRSLVEALLTGWLELLANEPERGPLHLRLYSQLLAARDPRVQQSLAPVTEQFRRLLARLPAGASSPLRWRIGTDCLIHELASVSALGLPAADFDAHVRELVDFVCSGISRPGA